MRIQSLLLTGALTMACTLVATAAVVLKPAPAPVAASPAAPSLTTAQTQFFETRIRPILVDNCYKCHSTESGKNKGDLLLDTRDSLLKGGKHGKVIVPGDASHSPLITAINYDDPDLQMPPKGEKLTVKQIADLTAWVNMGAPDPRLPVAGTPKLTGLNDKARAHWAYQPVKDPPVPQVKDASWVRTPVDSFVLAKLEQNGMKPSPPASREVLIRRATYDLIGLPPMPQEVTAFVNDSSPDAFAKVVDRLLASPHYGERWGRFWLDSARYSDTSGIENAKRGDYRYAYAWTYRDYVIKAFNDDKPYDTFLKEQIAADLLPTAKTDPASLAALGFITVGQRFANPNDEINERIDTLGKATMAMTIACARCHDHKFDPIPQSDYYSLHGIFSSTIEPAEKPLVAKVADTRAYEDFERKMTHYEQENREIYYDLVSSKSAEFRSKASPYLLAYLYGRKGAQDEQTERNKLIAENSLQRDLYQGGLRSVSPKSSVFSALYQFSRLSSQDFSTKGRKILAEVVAGGNRRMPVNPLVAAAFKKMDPDSLHSLRDVTDVYGKLFKEIMPQAKAYIEACRTSTADTVEGYDPALVELIDVPATIEPSPLLTTTHLRELAPRLPVVNQGGYRQFNFAAINELELTDPAAPARAMVVADSPRPHDSYVFIRGEATNRGPLAPREFLEILSGPNRKPFTQGSGRLELAECIANSKNPLTARVAVNRIWMHHFGQAFVRTPDDLGVQSEPPSHPELLDYLASRFMQDGWSFKQMHRMIMLSNAYQQSSDNNPAYSTKDPENRLVWRANLRRLDFEAIRDSMLQFTGKLDLTIGGKPVNLTDEPYSNRRSVYGYVDRGNLPELMSQFDFSDPDMANSQRTSTIVPQQALFFMNSPMSADVARKVTSRPEFIKADDDAGRVKALYEVLFQRAPRADEIQLASDFLKAHSGEAVLASKDVDTPNLTSAAARKRAARGKTSSPPRKVAKSKFNPRATVQNQGERVDRQPLTVWEQYAQALLFTNEIVYVN